MYLFQYSLVSPVVVFHEYCTSNTHTEESVSRTRYPKLYWETVKHILIWVALCFHISFLKCPNVTVIHSMLIPRSYLQYMNSFPLWLKLCVCVSFSPYQLPILFTSKMYPSQSSEESSFTLQWHQLHSVWAQVDPYLLRMLFGLTKTSFFLQSQSRNCIPFPLLGKLSSTSFLSQQLLSAPSCMWRQVWKARIGAGRMKSKRRAVACSKGTCSLGAGSISCCQQPGWEACLAQPSCSRTHTSNHKAGEISSVIAGNSKYHTHTHLFFLLYRHTRPLPGHLT